MDKIDPKLTAAKVYPIDRVTEAFDEPQYGDAMPDPALHPLDFSQKLLAGLAVGSAFLIVVYSLM